MDDLTGSTERTENELSRTMAGRAFMAQRLLPKDSPHIGQLRKDALRPGQVARAAGVQQACFLYEDGSVLGWWDDRAFVFDTAWDLGDYVEDNDLDENHVAWKILDSLDEDDVPDVEDCDAMDGDHESALASAGHGNDESYGGPGDERY